MATGKRSKKAVHSLQALTDSLAAERNNAPHNADGFNKPIYRHNEINYDALNNVVNEMGERGGERIKVNNRELIEATLDKFETTLMPKLYRGKSSLLTLSRSEHTGVSGLAKKIMSTLDKTPNQRVPLFIHMPDVMVDANMHAWGAIMRYVARGLLISSRFVKVDESELLTKNRSGFTGTQKNASLTEQKADVVLFSAADIDAYNPTEAATLAMLFRHWAESETAVIVVSPRPFETWLSRLPREVQPMVATLFAGNIIEPPRKANGNRRAGAKSQASTQGLNHAALQGL